MVFAFLLAGTAAAFTLSAAAGIGGSLILVPALSIVLGPKQGIALATVLLGCNNFVKVILYRDTIPLRSALGVLVLIMLGAAVGARLMVASPQEWVSVAVVASMAFTLIGERIPLGWVRRMAAPLWALGAGVTSGYAGSSGPLKAAALRSLNLDRFHFVGAASVVSLGGDAVKGMIFAEASLLSDDAPLILLAAVPVMILGSMTGRLINRNLGERAYTLTFWAIMTAYTARVLLR